MAKAKYGNRKVVREGITFDSLKEYRRFCELRLLEKAGQITNLQRQVKFELIPTQRDASGKLLEKACSYVADFVYYDPALFADVVEDTKGFRTTEYIIKRKLMLYRHGIKIKEV